MSAFDPSSVFFSRADRGFLDAIREDQKQRFSQAMAEPLIEFLTTIHLISMNIMAFGKATFDNRNPLVSKVHIL